MSFDDRVDEPGEAALRGTVDVFPGTDEQPLRVRLDDGVIAAIDRYDPVTQRTDASAGETILYPASEVVLDEGCIRRFLRGEEEEAEEASAGGEPWTRRLLSGTRDEPRRVCALEHCLPLFCQRRHTVFELLPGAPLILDPEAGERRDAWFEQIAEAYRHRIAMMAASRSAQADQLPPLPPDRLYLDEAEWSRNLHGRLVVEIGENGGEAIDLGTAPVPRFVEGSDPSRALVRYVEARRKEGDRVVLAASADSERRRFAHLVERRLATDPKQLPRWRDASALDPGAIAIAPLDLAEGFTLPGWTVIAAADVFPGAARLAASCGKPGAELFASDALRIGDLVVHSERGLGQVGALEHSFRNWMSRSRTAG